MHTTSALNASRLSQPAILNPAARREVVFIDTALAAYRTLETQLAPGSEVVHIGGLQDGLAQIAHWARSHSAYDAIHILSHGAAGRFELGSAQLGAGLALAQREQLAVIGRALSADGDLMLYACELAAGSAGRQLVREIAAAAGVTVAASTTFDRQCRTGRQLGTRSRGGPDRHCGAAVAWLPAGHDQLHLRCGDECQ
jgi:hypothetical protein